MLWREGQLPIGLKDPRISSPSRVGPPPSPLLSHHMGINPRTSSWGPQLSGLSMASIPGLGCSGWVYVFCCYLCLWVAVRLSVSLFVSSCPPSLLNVSCVSPDLSLSLFSCLSVFLPDLDQCSPPILTLSHWSLCDLSCWGRGAETEVKVLSGGLRME